MSEAVLNALGELPYEWIVLIVAALPLIELRGAIPIGVALGLPALEVFLLAMLGNMAPVPLILLLLGPVRRWANRWPLVGPVLRWAEERAWKRRAQVEKYGFWGLVAFVGVPLPGTGAWTGSLVAVLLEMRFWPALLANLLGVLIAGVLIALLSALGLNLVQSL
ncbi:MAG: COG2426 family protein [Bacillota bacterium]